MGAGHVVLGRWTWVGAGALGVFTLMASLIAHRFWELEGQARFFATNTFFEHMGLIAGFFLVAALDASRRSGRA